MRSLREIWRQGWLGAAGIIFLVCGAAAEVMDSTAPQNAAKTIWRATIRSTINPATANYLRDAIARAERDRSEALIIELDTPGGLLTSVRDMVQAIDEAQVPVVVYVSPAGASATSAGALLMLGAHVAAMGPGTNIGAAHPVGPQGEEIKGPMGEKSTNDTAAFARSLAETRGRNVELAQEIVSRSKSFTSEEALSKKIIDLIAPDLQGLIKQLHGRKVIVSKKERTLSTEGVHIAELKMTTGQQILNTLANPNIAGLLMTLGILLIYFELSSPGVSLPGALGAICILVAFMTFQLIPIRMGGVLLLVLGIGMLLAEPFVVSGGALAAGGILAFILGLIWVVDPSETVLRIGPAIWVPAAIILGGFVGIIGIMAARMKRQTAEALERMGGGALSGLSGYDGVVNAAVTDSKGGSSGTATFRGESWNFTSADPVQAGDAVTVIGVKGMKVKVRLKQPR